MCVCVYKHLYVFVSVLFIECNFHYSYDYLQVEHSNEAEVGHVKHIDMVLLVIRHEPLWNELAAKKQFLISENPGPVSDVAALDSIEPKDFIELIISD